MRENERRQSRLNRCYFGLYLSQEVRSLAGRSFQQRLPCEIAFPRPGKGGGFFVQQAGLGRGAATRPERRYPDDTAHDTLRDGDDITHPDQMSGLPDDGSVDGDRSSGAKA